MKRISIFAFLVVGMCALAFAEGRMSDISGMGNNSNSQTENTPRSQFFNNLQQRSQNLAERVRIPRITTEKVTVEGELTIAHGMLAVKTEDITWLVMGLDRYIGFIDELKAGASVSLEGSAITYPLYADTKVLRTSKLTVAGKDYDVGTSGTMMGWTMGAGMMGMMFNNIQPNIQPRNFNQRETSPRTIQPRENNSRNDNSRSVTPKTPQQPRQPMMNRSGRG